MCNTGWDRTLVSHIGRQILYHLSHQRSPLVRRVVLIYIFAILFNVWFHRRQLSCHICFCILAIETFLWKYMKKNITQIRH